MRELEQTLAAILPGARLEVTALPASPTLRLHLLAGDYPQCELSQADVQRIMDNPLYWVFCWASGQVLAEYVLGNPALVAGRRVLDFGCGSGVAGIAAALAGASQVIACDTDPLALAASRENARLNDVQLSACSDFDHCSGEIDLILAADVLYDRANLPWLGRLAARAPRVLVADSRVRDFEFPPYREIARQRSHTLPDLDESDEFGNVRVYLAAW